MSLQGATNFVPSWHHPAEGTEPDARLVDDIVTTLMRLVHVGGQRGGRSR